MVSPSSFIAGSMSRLTYMLKVMEVWLSSIGTKRSSFWFEKAGIKANDLKKIKKMVDDNADIIIKRWKEYFDKDKMED